MDEPTTGLDPKARREVWTVIENLRKMDKTVFLTTHYTEEAQVLDDRIAIIDKGKIAAISSPEELISRYGGHKVLVIRKGDKRLVQMLQDKHEQAELNSHGDILVAVDDVNEFWDVMDTLTGIRTYNAVEIRTLTLEDVFLKIVGAKARAKTLKEMIAQDVKDEKKAIDMDKEVIELAQKDTDVTMAFLFMEILKDEDHHDTFTTLLEQV